MRARGAPRSSARAIGAHGVASLALAMAATLAGACRSSPDPVEDRAIEVERGRDLIAAYGCTGCHEMPHVTGAHGTIGPPLDHWSRRRVIAGRLPNRPDLLIRWIRDPQVIDPETAMPDLGVTEPEARQIAAFLFSLE